MPRSKGDGKRGKRMDTDQPEGGTYVSGKENGGRSPRFPPYFIV